MVHEFSSSWFFDFSLAASGEEEKLTVRFSAFCKERQILKKRRHNAFTGSILYKMRNDFAFERSEIESIRWRWGARAGAIGKG